MRSSRSLLAGALRRQSSLSSNFSRRPVTRHLSSSAFAALASRSQKFSQVASATVLSPISLQSRSLSTSPLASSTSTSSRRSPTNSNHRFQSRSHASAAPPKSDGLLCALEGDPYHKTYKVIEPDFQIVDSTLREGEQFATMHLTTEDKLHIAKALDDIGVEYIEIMNPVASAQSAKDCELISNMGLKAKVASHVRCHLHDIKVAIDAGVDVIHMYMATSFALKQFSHGKETDQIIEAAKEAIQYCKDRGVEVRFSCEDTFRSNMSDLLSVYTAVSEFGVDRIGLADTVGVASPLQVLDVVRRIRESVTCDMEYHTHNDTGCCIANALIALQGGVTHIDTSVLGLGERNGITPLGGFLARMYTYNEAYQHMIRDRYDLKALRSLEEYVAKCADVEIPFNNCVTGWSSFTHKAGVHSKAVLKNPSSYEVLNPDDFGVGRDIKFASRLTGWNAVGERAIQLGLKLPDSAIKEASAFVKTLADTRRVDMEVLDRALQNLGLGKDVTDGISCPASARPAAATGAQQTATAAA